MRSRGFTLIELLVVIAIIGILPSVVLVSLNSARAKARDSQRISDLKQISIALELHHTDRGGYPSELSVANLVTPGYIASIPTPPPESGQTSYIYAAIGSRCSSFHLGAELENLNHSVHLNDADAPARARGTNCPDADGTPNNSVAADFDGQSPVCNDVTATSPDPCYDISN